MRKIKTGFMFVELLLVLAVVMFIAFKVFKLYFNNPPLNPEAQRVISEQGIDTTNYKTIIDSTQEKLDAIQNKHNDELSRIE